MQHATSISLPEGILDFLYFLAYMFLLVDKDLILLAPLRLSHLTELTNLVAFAFYISSRRISCNSCRDEVGFNSEVVSSLLGLNLSSSIFNTEE